MRGLVGVAVVVVVVVDDVDVDVDVAVERAVEQNELERVAEQHVQVEKWLLHKGRPTAS